MGLIDDAGKGPIGLDTAPFIYLIEEHPRFLRVVEPLFVAIDTGRRAAIARRLASEAQSLFILYEYGILHGGVRVRARPGDRLLPVAWGMLPSHLLRSAARPGGSHRQRPLARSSRLIVVRRRWHRRPSTRFGRPREASEGTSSHRR